MIISIIGMFLTFLGLELFLVAGIIAVTNVVIRMINPKAEVRQKDKDMLSAILATAGVCTLVGLVTILVIKALLNT